MTWIELRDLVADRGLRVSETDPGSDSGARVVAGITHDSRRVEPGQVFVALKGLHADGTSFALDAVKRGALGVLAEQPAPPGIGVPWMVVSDARLALALGAAKYYGDPSSDMQVVGITGTNGKTTVAFLVASMFEAAKIRCGVLGTFAV